MKQTDVQIDYAIEIDVANSEIIRPMSGSSAHPAAGKSISRVQSTQGCGKKYYVTNEELAHRPNDAAATVSEDMRYTNYLSRSIQENAEQVPSPGGRGKKQA